MQFYTGRFSLLPAKQSIFYELGSEQRFDIILKLLSHDDEFTSRGMRIILEPLKNEEGKWIGGKIGKKAERVLPVLREGHMVKAPETLYPHVMYTLIPEEQLILIQRDRAVFSSDIGVFALLEDFFAEKLLEQGLEVAIHPLTTRGKFWNDIARAEKLYNVKFHLEMPNFLGNSERELKETLEDIKGKTNSNTIDVGVSNKGGELKVENNAQMQAMVNWAEKGAGKWEITVKFSNWLKPKKVKSTDQLRVLECCEGANKTILPHDTIEEIRSHRELDSLRIKRTQ